jgi:uncharacterized protein YjbI with pentapeptide repeats
MKTYTVDELAEILRLHQLYLDGHIDGKKADLSYSNLSYSNLSYSNLRYSNLSYSDLRGCDLSGCDLSGSNLSYSNLRYSNLSGCNLSRCNLILIGQDIRGYLFWATDEDGYVTIRAGCRQFTGIAAAREHWEARHLDDPVLHADCLSLVQRCETMAQVRGWKLEPDNPAEEE